jgi:DNA-directed RNA polymerase specialized sigma24 family protein
MSQIFTIGYCYVYDKKTAINLLEAQMSLSSLIGPQIPLLRRYARALSGSQASGDSYVAAVLETLLADPAMYDRSAEPRAEV